MVELTTTVAIVGIVAATSVPYLGRLAAKGKLRDTSRDVLMDISEARTLARSGRDGFAGWTEEQRVLQSGFRVLSPTSYQIFVDADDRDDGVGEIVIRTVDLPEGVTIAATPGAVRFRRNGTTTHRSDVEVDVAYPALDLEATLNISFGGRIKLAK